MWKQLDQHLISADTIVSELSDAELSSILPSCIDFHWGHMFCPNLLSPYPAL